MAEPPAKKRRVQDLAPRYSGSPTERRGNEAFYHGDSSPDPLQAPIENLSIHRGRSTSRSTSSRSRSPSRSRSHSRESGADDERRSSKSRDRSASKSQSPSRYPSRSRSSSRSRSRSGYPTRSPSPTRSRSDTRSRRSVSQSSSLRSRSHRLSASTSESPADRGVPPLEPLRPNFRPHLRLLGHTAAVGQVRISPNGRWIASASSDGTVKIWDAATGAHYETLTGHLAGVSCVAWSRDSNTLATGSDDKTIRLWDRLTAEPGHSVADGGRVGAVRRGTARGGLTGTGPLVGHHNYVYCLAFSPKGNILASGSYDEAVFLWDVRAGRQMRSLPAHGDPVSGIDFCPDGTMVVSCSTDGLIRIWDTATGQCLRTLVHEDNPAVTHVCFSPNGLFVLAFSLDNCIRLYDYISGTGSVKKTYEGHLNAAFSIGGCFVVLKDDHVDTETGEVRTQPFIASASENGDIVIWDVVSKDIVQRISGAHKSLCFWVDVHEDTLVSAGQDGVIRVFRNKKSRENSEPDPAEKDGVDSDMANGLDGKHDADNDEFRTSAKACELGEPYLGTPHFDELKLAGVKRMLGRA